MYETPQYLTPNGFIRSAKNPYRKKLEADKSAEAPAALKKNKLLTARARVMQKKQQQFELSDKAALLIAQALKGMLRK